MLCLLCSYICSCLGLCCKEPLLLSISCAVLVCRNNTGRRHNNSPREGEILEKQLKVKFMGGRVVVSRCSLCAVCRRRAIHPSLTSFIHSEVVVVLQQNDALLLLCVDKYYKHSREWPLSVSSVAGCNGQSSSIGWALDAMGSCWQTGQTIWKCTESFNYILAFIHCSLRRESVCRIR